MRKIIKILFVLAVSLPFLTEISFSQNFIPMSDTRAISTFPNSYNQRFEGHFKVSSAIGLPWGDNPYYGVLGFRGWIDDTGGKGHELAFSNHGKIYWRSGYDASGWESWKQIMVSDGSGNLIVNGDLYSKASSNEGGSISLVNSLKTGQAQANRWTIYNMTGNYGNSLQFCAYDLAGCGDINGLCSSRFTIMDSGNVGIGTTTPAEKLSVNGKIRAHEVKVEVSNWPDYVFDEGHKIETLEKLESYIKVNKHLPEMPSAEHIEREGLTVGVMIKLQQKKIEELTLYLIEKDKALNKSEKKTAELESEVKIITKRLLQIEQKLNK
ncbi:hypothetical protein QWY86_15595 [Pedobacter aquatilis]|uniref:hypothetical protein n=1 Tax=Pedobacter aquatilis TaxID=351343 RepID=UPI0025B52807|nr:hypothetical protein [Pedobacter aquatilis]MDN3588107.1 hypothetical protein [Pedobacter aquatilis]